VFLPARAYAAKRTAGDSIAACRASWSTGNTRRLATTLAWAKFFSQGSDDANTRTPQHKTVSKRRRDLESSLPTFQSTPSLPQLTAPRPWRKASGRAASSDDARFVPRR
jgi:hypothetical protein